MDDALLRRLVEIAFGFAHKAGKARSGYQFRLYLSDGDICGGWADRNAHGEPGEEDADGDYTFGWIDTDAGPDELYDAFMKAAREAGL